jgi:hypothetical protein
VNRAVKYNESYLNEVSVTPLYSSSIFISARHVAAEKIHIYSPESQVKQQKQEKEDGGRGRAKLICTALYGVV